MGLIFFPEPYPWDPEIGQPGSTSCNFGINSYTNDFNGFRIEMTGSGTADFTWDNYEGAGHYTGLQWDNIHLSGTVIDTSTYQAWDFSFVAANPAPVPEPATLLLFLAGFIGLALFRKKICKQDIQ